MAEAPYAPQAYSNGWTDGARTEREKVAAVLDALNVEDLRRAWVLLRFGNGMEAAQLAERLRIAADALHALEADNQTPTKSQQQSLHHS